MEFEWDEAKNVANQLKHGIRFEDMEEAFRDPHQLVLNDSEHSTEAEKRYWLIGRVTGCIVLVVFTQRKKRLRIISARPANRQERNVYERQKTV